MMVDASPKRALTLAKWGQRCGQCPETHPAHVTKPQKALVAEHPLSPTELTLNFRNISSMDLPKRTVRVGVAALIADAKGAMVIGRRKGSSGAGKHSSTSITHKNSKMFILTRTQGQYGFPGGHQEFGETYFQCAEREALEETGLAVTAVRLVAVTDSVFDERSHYITLFVECRQDVPGEEAKVRCLATKR